MPLNPKTLPNAMLRATGALTVLVVGILFTTVGLGLFTPDYWMPWLSGIGISMMMVSVVWFGIAVARAFETDWGDDVATPSLSPESFSAALDDGARPGWVCTACRVHQSGPGIGMCIFCDSGTSYYVLESDEDVSMVRASMG